jgi:hypothetical protein
MAVLYGFHNLTDILDQRAAEVEPQILSTAVDAAAAAHNQDISEALSLFVQPTQRHTIGISVMAEGELQGVDQWGRPDPIRFPAPVARYFPLFMAQTSIGFNYVLTQKMTVQEVNDRLQAMFIADAKWMRRQLLSALFTNTAYNFTDPQFGTYAVSVLANADAETYLRSSTGAASADTHHKGAATLTEAALTDVRAELVEHEENGGADAQVVVFVPTASVAAVQAHTGFVAAVDPNVTYGTGIDQYVGSFAATAPGTPIGYNKTAMVHLREWSRLPADYMIGVTGDGLKPLAMREDEEQSLRGFREIPGREDMPYLQRIWSRRAGFGAWNRVGAVVYRTNSGTYAIPTGFQAPN